jgi:mannose-6-phosphate isomerase-like protein (cupin superfamily)
MPSMSSGPDAIAPDGSEIWLRVTDARRASLVEVRLGAGAVSLPVRHRTVEEIWYVLAGRGRVWRQPPGGAGRTIEVEPGSALVIPTGWAFQFAAWPGADLRFVCYTSPPWPGDQEAEGVGEGGLSPPPSIPGAGPGAG